MRRWVDCAVVVMVFGMGLAGCSGPTQQEITGTVTLDDRPVPDGHIRFDPTDGKTSSAEAFLKDGKYTAKVTAGNYKVEIYSPRSKGKATRIAGPGADAEEVEETIPEKYNVNTQLKVDVTKDKKVYDFPLRSK